MQPWFQLLQWLLMTMAVDEELCSACLWMCTGQFDSNLVELEGRFYKIFKNKVMSLLQKNEQWCNAAMKNSNPAVSTKKGLNCGIWVGLSWVGLLLMKSKENKNLWIKIGSLLIFTMLLIKCLTGTATQHPTI